MKPLSHNFQIFFAERHQSYIHSIKYKSSHGKINDECFGFDKVLSEREAAEKEAYLRSIGAVKIVDSVADSLFFVG
jgi:hypothetical protein